MRTIRTYTRRQGPNRYIGGCVEQDRAANILINHSMISPKARSTKQEALEDAKAYKSELLKK